MPKLIHATARFGCNSWPICFTFIWTVRPLNGCVVATEDTLQRGLAALNGCVVATEDTLQRGLAAIADLFVLHLYGL